MNRSVSIFSVVVVMIVTVLATVAVAFAQIEDDSSEVGARRADGDHKITICHKDRVTISVDTHAWPAHERHGDTESACQTAGTLPEEPSEGATLTTDATETATLPDGTISDVATLDVPEGTTGTIEFKLYGPFTAEDAPDSAEDCTSENLIEFSSTKTVPDDEDTAGSGQYTSDPFTPTEAGIYNWTATFTPDSGQGDPSGEIGCGETVEQSIVNDEAATTATEQNMTLAGEIGGATNPADPATDTTNIEDTDQNDNTTLGTDSDDDLIGDSSANILLGREGNDFLDGGTGRDRMVGGRKYDYINGADGKPGDVLNGGIGTDYCVGDVGDEFNNCDGNVVQVGVPHH